MSCSLAFEVNILTWGLDVFCFSVRVHYCLISCPSCQSFQIQNKAKTRWKPLWMEACWVNTHPKNIFRKISLKNLSQKNHVGKISSENITLVGKISLEKCCQKSLIRKMSSLKCRQKSFVEKISLESSDVKCTILILINVFIRSRKEKLVNVVHWIRSCGS